jgi:hypothetical protein
MDLIEECPNVQKVRKIRLHKVIITVFLPLIVAIYKMWLK